MASPTCPCWDEKLGQTSKRRTHPWTNKCFFEKNRNCSACQAGKQVGVKHPVKNVVTTERPLELLHMDIFGPIAYISLGGNKYGFIIVDDYSRFTWVFFLRDKSEVHGFFKRFAKSAQNEFDVKIKRVRSDNRTEFKNTYDRTAQFI